MRPKPSSSPTPTPSPVCLQKPDPGFCEAYVPSYYFDNNAQVSPNFSQHDNFCENNDFDRQSVLTSFGAMSGTLGMQTIHLGWLWRSTSIQDVGRMSKCGMPRPLFSHQRICHTEPSTSRCVSISVPYSHKYMPCRVDGLVLRQCFRHMQVVLVLGLWAYTAKGLRFGGRMSISVCLNPLGQRLEPFEAGPLIGLLLDHLSRWCSMSNGYPGFLMNIKSMM